MIVLLGTVAILAAAPIHTDTSNGHFIALGIPFLAVLVIFPTGPSSSAPIPAS